ncbi:hypothetical protein BC936DRAFT_149254 [Jimgerdemannia flammicorona]|uniref:Uncharacterized protein n=1 Tax=Jimgerdemannia flammicorona TaxID=994334 RepID=A0A433D183_9FUNG|nr:hypothetical protein BC936DRAFT_149254 [Jimgerdemannia flammicorona]
MVGALVLEITGQRFGVPLTKLLISNTVVSAFNASQKTAEETVRDVEVIVKSRDLFLRFKALVSRALQEREKAEAAASASAEA